MIESIHLVRKWAKKGRSVGRRTLAVAWSTVAASLAVATAALVLTAMPVMAQSPSWLSSAVIYCVDPEIFSTSGLSGVTAQLPRLKSLGVNTIWIMPIYPRGVPCTVGGVQHTAFNSPYCINNFEGVDPNIGTGAQLTTLISTAHADGMKVILDVALNATSWDNPLVTAHPEYYKHSDGNLTNTASIVNAWGDADIAQLDLSTNANGAQTYVENVMSFWESTYGFDGFRFDSADNPGGPTRLFNQTVAQAIATTMRSMNPNVLLLGEEFDQIQLALAPYGLDYDVFNFQNALQQACASGNSAAALQSSWSNSFSGWPSGMLHMAVGQDWDTNSDLTMYGGTSQCMDAAVTNFTIGGYVPEIFNGEEVANTSSGNNTHNQIIWNGANATAFTNFFTSLIALRNNHPALQTNGTMTWETNSDTSAVSTYDRLSGSDELFVEVNFNSAAQSGTVTVPSGGAWVDVSPPGSPGGTSHQLPSTGSFSLAGYDFAIFSRSTTPQPPATPTGLAPTVGNTQIGLSWNASSGATTYNVYRGTSAGGEGTTAIATGITSTTYTNTGLTNGTTYYYEVAAVNSVGTSGMSSEVHGTPSSVTGSLTGTPTNVTTAQAFNLTTQGTSDWAAWGFNGIDHDTSGGSKISNASVFGTGSLTSFSSTFLGFTWTNGTPDASETNETNGYFNNAGVGDGIQFTVPAGTTTQTLYVYVGGWSTGGTLTATLSDGSAAAYSNSSMSNAGNSYYGYYALTFNAASAGQTLTVVWKEASGTGNVTLYAAALAGASLPTAATPTMSPAPGTYSTTQSVTLADTTTGATIYYTTNGTTPTTSSTVYTGAISVSSTETIEAMAVASGFNNSAVASGTYTITLPTAATPTFSPAPGSYNGTQSVTLADTTTGAAIHYTTDGSTPTAASTTYSSAISVSSTETIKAMAVASGFNNSAVASGTYTITQIPAAPTNLGATAGNSQVSLTWTGSTGATSYNVYRGTAAGGESGTPIATGIAGTSYTNTGLTNGTAYYYKVAAVNSAGTSGMSNEKSATPAAAAEAPYGGTAWAIPGTVQFENFDTGGEGVAYHDTDTTNNGGQYRTTEGVDIEACTDTGGGYNVGWTQPGEWMNYTVNVATAGSYTISFRVASGAAGGTFHIKNAAGTNLTGTVTVPGTGGWQTWTTVTATVTLPAGQQILTWVQDTGAGTCNLNSMSFAATGGGGGLSGTLTTVTTAQAFNLTAQGTTDWAAWGYGTGNFEHSSAGGSKISNAAVAGGGAMTAFTSSFLGSTWTNGSPDVSVTNETNGFYNNGGVGDGFSFTVPASTTVQHVTVYVGGWSSGGTLTATLSDGSAIAYTNSGMSNASNSYYGHYDLTYNAASASQTLTITWKEASGTGNVTLYSAALH